MLDRVALPEVSLISPGAPHGLRHNDSPREAAPADTVGEKVDLV